MYEYRIDTEGFRHTLTDPVERQKMLDAIGEFSKAHGVAFDLLKEEYKEIAVRMPGNDALVFTIEELDGMYKRKLAIYIVNGIMHEIYGVYNEYGEIMPFSYGIDYSMVM